MHAYVITLTINVGHWNASGISNNSDNSIERLHLEESVGSLGNWRCSASCHKRIKISLAVPVHFRGRYAQEGAGLREWPRSGRTSVEVYRGGIRGFVSQPTKVGIGFQSLVPPSTVRTPYTPLILQPPTTDRVVVAIS